MVVNSVYVNDYNDYDCDCDDDDIADDGEYDSDDLRMTSEVAFISPQAMQIISFIYSRYFDILYYWYAGNTSKFWVSSIISKLLY